MASAILHDSHQVLQELENTLLSMNTHLHHIEEYAAHIRTHLQQVVTLGARSQERTLYLEALWETWQADSHKNA